MTFLRRNWYAHWFDIYRTPSQLACDIDRLNTANGRPHARLWGASQAGKTVMALLHSWNIEGTDLPAKLWFRSNRRKLHTICNSDGNKQMEGANKRMEQKWEQRTKKLMCVRCVCNDESLWVSSEHFSTLYKHFMVGKGRIGEEHRVPMPASFSWISLPEVYERLLRRIALCTMKD